MRKCLLLSLFCLAILMAGAQEKHILTSDSVSLYVKVKGTGPVCLYIHGGPGSGSNWLEKLYGETLEKHFKVIYLDQRGVGRSSTPKDGNYCMDRMTRDFEEVREALGIQQWLTLGHSFGGILQMGYVERYPQSNKGMLMINCTLDIEESFRNSWITKAYEIMGEENPAAKGDTMPVQQRLQEAIGLLHKKGLMWKMTYSSPEHEKQMNDTYKDIPNWNHDFSGKALNCKEYWKNYRPETSGIDIPVLVFYGTRDWLVGPDHYKGLNFPNKLLWKSEVGHMPFMEAKQDLEKAIVSYLDKYKFK
ncbi:MAG TPA: alpha/beta hydrolase [Prolixibacteraceae bacterium]|nr:alpha/beta hydrolase [Prolixibacteraceae bacterium]